MDAREILEPMEVFYLPDRNLFHATENCADISRRERARLVQAFSPPHPHGDERRCDSCWPPDLRTLRGSGGAEVVYHISDECPDYAPATSIGRPGDFPRIVTAAWPDDEYLKLANDRSTLCPTCIPSLDRLMPQGGLD
jgi:hypothetical protein